MSLVTQDGADKQQHPRFYLRLIEIGLSRLRVSNGPIVSFFRAPTDSGAMQRKW